MLSRMNWLAAVLILFVGFCSPAIAKTSSSSGSKMETFDFVFMPKLNIGGGKYKIGDIDEGDYSSAAFGLRAAFKVGPLLVGGEYLEGEPWARSTKEFVSDADRDTYPQFKGYKAMAWGWSFGLVKDRLILWYNYYGYNKVKDDITVSDLTYKFHYLGPAHMVELHVRVTNEIYLGVYGRTQKFDKYTTEHPVTPVKNQRLDPALETTEYGITIAALLPTSAMGYGKLFSSSGGKK